MTTQVFVVDISKGPVKLSEVVYQYIQAVMVLTNGRQAEAARLMGMDRKTLSRKLKKATTKEIINESI